MTDATGQESSTTHPEPASAIRPHPEQPSTSQERQEPAEPASASQERQEPAEPASASRTRRAKPETGPSWSPKLVALDIDGTILDHDSRLSDRVRAAVRAVADLGTHVIIATGRSLDETVPVLDRLGLVEGWAVCSNGSVTLRLDPELADGFETTDVVTFDPKPVLTLLRQHLPTALYALESGRGGFLLTAPFPPGELEGTNTRVAADFDEFMSEPACRVVVRSPEHTSDDFLALTKKLGLHGVNYAVGWTAWLDLAPEGVSKASALEVIRGRLGVDAGATLAVGDGRNDLEMFAWAGRSVAMGNATDDVKAEADLICGTVLDDGLAEVLEALVP